ncbi:MAG: hypothetical protein JKX85_00230 [Phycisphaeraceae bacterium]|nr:hypothetical protein [Phycisphaeraceae bacterium]
MNNLTLLALGPLGFFEILILLVLGGICLGVLIFAVKLFKKSKPNSANNNQKITQTNDQPSIIPLLTYDFAQ